MPLVIAALVLAAAFTGLALAAPDLVTALLAKEGPVEHASHLVLLVSVLTWLVLSRRVRYQQRFVATIAALFLAFVLAEELDWGAVYSWSGPGEAIARTFGHRNMHNAARGASYLLFAVPLAAYFAWPRVPLAPTRDERLTFALLAVLFVACNLTAWERLGQELLEALVYTLTLAISVRHLRHTFDGPPASHVRRHPSRLDRELADLDP